MCKNRCNFLAYGGMIMCILYIVMNVCLAIYATGHVTEPTGGSMHYELFFAWEWSAVNWIAVGVIAFCSILLMLPWMYSVSDLKKSCKLTLGC